jgi:hypothetical protein
MFSSLEANALRLGQTLKSYVLWTHPRGGFHYDVMVTLILVFIFLTPRSVFKDSPAYRPLHPNEITVRQDGANSFVYDLSASSVVLDDQGATAALKRAIEPIAGSIEISRYTELRDTSGKLTGYRVWARHR